MHLSYTLFWCQSFRTLHCRSTIPRDSQKCSLHKRQILKNRRWGAASRELYRWWSLKCVWYHIKAVRIFGIVVGYLCLVEIVKAVQLEPTLAFCSIFSCPLASSSFHGHDNLLRLFCPRCFYLWGMVAQSVGCFLCVLLFHICVHIWIRSTEQYLYKLLWSVMPTTGDKMWSESGICTPLESSFEDAAADSSLCCSCLCLCTPLNLPCECTFEQQPESYIMSEVQGQQLNTLIGMNYTPALPGLFRRFDEKSLRQHELINLLGKDHRFHHPFHP